jgi:hypothetical protein
MRVVGKGAWAGLALVLAGCGAESAIGPVAAVGAGSVVLIGRTPVDAAISLAKGQDCSIVRLDKGESYCAPPPAAPPPDPFCTKSLGAVDCWVSPPKAQPPHLGLGDRPPTPPPRGSFWDRPAAAPAAAPPAAAAPTPAAAPAAMPPPEGRVISPIY